MRKVIAYLLMFVLVGTVYAQRKKWYEGNLVVVEYDRFKDETTISSDKNQKLMSKWIREFRKRPCLFTGITFEGKIPEDSAPLVNMAFFSVSDSWEFLSSHDLRALVNGEPMEMPETQHSGDVNTGGVLEFVLFELSWDEFCKLCDAEMVEFQLGFEEFEAGEPEVTLWRQVRQTYLDLLEEK